MRLCTTYAYDLTVKQLGLGKGFAYRQPKQLCMKGIQVDEVASIALEKIMFLSATDHISLLKRWVVFATGRVIAGQ
jgi:hypothetical protein